MYIEDKNSGEKFEAEVIRVGDKELGRIKRDARFDFDWSLYKGKEVYKLHIRGTEQVLGLMHVIDRPEEGFDFLEIDAIEVSKENRGAQEGLGRIGGCLLGFAAVLSGEYGHDGFLGLVAKNERAKVFHEKFGFEYIGRVGVLGERMCSATANSIWLVSEYVTKSLTDEKE
jgi:hypothetical protein